MLALRTADGLDLTNLGHRYGIKTAEKVLEGLQHYISKELVTKKEANGVVTARLNDPRGFLQSNDIIASVFAKFM